MRDITARTKFMESLLSPMKACIGTMNRSPLSRPSATLSPARSGGEGRERGQFMECVAEDRVRAGIPIRRFPSRSILAGTCRDENMSA
jgi:hypothetical protein